ncbi:MAG: isoprenylcysteine carboxylmethyltransferase family protein [Armatimonadetes bacterium]|nr:isoprenylcysteine carboxylmethyltransferase family protein [Armatimonadota bacterium]
MSEEADRRMSRWGIGPVWTVLSLVYALGIYVLERRYFPDLKMIWPPVSVGMAMAILLFAAGVVIYVAALRRLHAALGSQTLQTEGIYGWMRHPIYSAFILFIVPALVLVARSILGLSVPVVMYILFRVFIRREERHLAERFGDRYWRWRRRTNAILPAPPMPDEYSRHDDE